MSEKGSMLAGLMVVRGPRGPFHEMINEMSMRGRFTYFPRKPESLVRMNCWHGTTSLESFILAVRSAERKTLTTCLSVWWISILNQENTEIVGVLMLVSRPLPCKTHYQSGNLA